MNTKINLKSTSYNDASNTPIIDQKKICLNKLVINTKDENENLKDIFKKL